jgi:hypothetical protein
MDRIRVARSKMMAPTSWSPDQACGRKSLPQLALQADLSCTILVGRQCWYISVPAQQFHCLDERDKGTT